MDTLSALVNRLKNAGTARHAHLVVRHSTFSEAVFRALLRAKFIDAVSVHGEGKKRVLEATLAHKGGVPRFSHLRRVSAPGRRSYTRAADIRRVRRGAGALIVSTPRGVLTDAEARAQKVGGEPLFIIY